MIEKVSHVAASLNNSEKFIESIVAATKTMQEMGLVCEIQYTVDINQYTALIIGREAKP